MSDVFDLSKCAITPEEAIPPCERMIADPTVPLPPDPINDCEDKPLVLPPEPPCPSLAVTQQTLVFGGTPELNPPSLRLTIVPGRCCNFDFEMELHIPGVQGFQGFQGHQGNQGAGSQGNQGYQGTPGTQGYQGYQGYGAEWFFAELLDRGGYSASASMAGYSDADAAAYSWVERIQTSTGVWHDGPRSGDYNAYLAEPRLGVSLEAVQTGVIVLMRYSPTVPGTYEFRARARTSEWMIVELQDKLPALSTPGYDELGVLAVDGDKKKYAWIERVQTAPGVWGYGRLYAFHNGYVPEPSGGLYRDVPLYTLALARRSLTTSDQDPLGSYPGYTACELSEIIPLRRPAFWAWSPGEGTGISGSMGSIGTSAYQYWYLSNPADFSGTTGVFKSVFTFTLPPNGTYEVTANVQMMYYAGGNGYAMQVFIYNVATGGFAVYAPGAFGEGLSDYAVTVPISAMLTISGTTPVTYYVYVQMIALTAAANFVRAAPGQITIHSVD